jgi:hypothetical protein
VDDRQPIDSSPRSGSPDGEPEEIRTIGDFDSGASALWTLYRDEAKSRDEARIQTLKEDMDGVLIFVRSCLSVHITYLTVLMHIPIGWFILYGSHIVYNRQ